MSNAPFDSLAYSERLQEAGVPASQAAVHAKGMADLAASFSVFPEAMLRLESSLTQKFDAAQMKFETAQLKMAAEFEKLRSEFNVLKVMVGFIITLQIPIFFKLYFA
jgi:hypothetical protein